MGSRLGRRRGAAVGPRLGPLKLGRGSTVDAPVNRAIEPEGTLRLVHDADNGPASGGRRRRCERCGQRLKVCRCDR